MKLRVRSVNGGETVRIDLPANCNLQSLKVAITHKLNSSSTSPHPEVHLSLNKRDELQGRPEDSLQSFGITGGDLIFYTLDPRAFAVPILAGISETSETSKRVRDEVMTKNARNPNDQTLTLRELCASAAMKRASRDPGSIPQQPKEITVEQGSAEIEQEGTEPMEVEGESLEKSRSIPFFLERVLLEERENANSSHGLLVVAVHAVMLESGFVGFDVETSSSSLGFRLPQGWAAKGLVSLHYTLPELVGNSDKYVENVQLKFQLMGKFLVVYGSLVSANGTQHSRVSLEVGKFLPSIEHGTHLVGTRQPQIVGPKTEEGTFPKFRGNSTNKETQNVVSKIGECLPKIGELQDSSVHERALFELWRVVKDRLSMPVLSLLCEKAGLPLPSSFILLPTELKMKILEGLPAVDVARVGCVCTEFRFMSTNDELWKQKYRDEFGSLPPNGHGLMGSQRWKDAFARLWMQRKNISRVRRRTAEGRIWQPSRPLRRFPFSFGSPGFGISGGDFDRFPAIGGGDLFGASGSGGSPGFGNGGLAGGLPFRRSIMPDCDLNGWRGGINGHDLPDL